MGPTRCHHLSAEPWLILQHLPLFQELNNRLAAEITRLRTLLTGEGGGEAAGSPLTQGKDAYELEVSTLCWVTVELGVPVSPFCTRQFGFVVCEGPGVVVCAGCYHAASVLPGPAEGQRVRNPVPEAGDQLSQRRAADGTEGNVGCRTASAYPKGCACLPCVCLDSSLLPPGFKTAFHFCP